MSGLYTLFSNDSADLICKGSPFQFVPFKEFQGRQGENPATVQARLAKEVLEEIPDQFLSYMKTRNVKPKPPLQRSLTISSVHSLPPSEL